MFPQNSLITNNKVQALTSLTHEKLKITLFEETRVSMYLNKTIIPPVNNSTTAKKIQEPAWRFKITPTKILTNTNQTINRLGLEENRNKLTIPLNIAVELNISILWQPWRDLFCVREM